MDAFSAGDYVVWKWAGSFAHGTVIDIKPERTRIESKGATIVRNGNQEDPAVLITMDNGTLVLKLAHELQISKISMD